MKRHLLSRSTALLCLTLTANLALPLQSMAAAIALATEPLVTSHTSSVKPNVMFILDDSGSMGWDYLPDWANDNHPVSGTGYANMPELFRNAGFNGVAYNPATTYSPPVLFNADGSLNTTTYPNIGAPWIAVKNDAYGVQSTGTSNLVGSASYYTFIPGEYCSSDKMDACVVATAPTTVAGVLYDKPAGLRWCNSAALTACQSINNATYKYPRYPGLATPAVAATAKLTVTGGGTATSIKVNGFEILTAATATSGTTGTVASRIVTNINACTAAKVGACTIAGYSASKTGSVVTITAPVALGAITFTPTATGTMNKTLTAFSGGAPASAIPGSNVLTNIVSTTTSYPYPGTTTKAATRTDCAGATCTYTEEMTNYANWWTYYHTRMQSMKTSVSRAFKTLDNRFRVGFNSISYTGATDNALFLHIDTFELAHKNSWFTHLFAGKPNSSTPLRGAISNAGKLYANKVSGQTLDPVQYSCQQNFTILSTDGYWNTGNESSTYGPFNLTGGNVGDLDGGATPRPMKQGTTAVADTLADVAKYYYDTDLRTGALGNCSGGKSTDFPAGNPDVCTNNVFVSSTDNNVKQHMTTFTMGLGADGTLNFTTDYQTATSGDFYNLKKGLGSPTVNWPDPIAGTAGERIDDLWHAAVNGQGTYFSAKSPDQIIDGFTKALSSITAKVGSSAAAATSTLNPVAGNNYAYVASYTTVKWIGNLESRSINTNTGVVSQTATWCVESIPSGTCSAPSSIAADTSGSSTVYYCVTPSSTAATCTAPGVLVGTDCKIQMPVACTGTMPAKVGATTDTRTIYTPNNAGTALIGFDAAYAIANPANFSAAHINTLSQWVLLNPAQQTAAEGVNLINFLRGQNGFEDRASNAVSNRLYRSREAVFGDALESQPAYLSVPVFSYPDAGYSAFKSSQSAKADVVTGAVYIGANDGMLHAFAADTGSERWAYVPSMVIPNLWKLADTNYASKHNNFVNGSPIMSDVYGGGVWHTILVGGLNGGGRGYYALDITNPSTPTLLWEFTTADDANIGYGFGAPVITKLQNGTWVVLVTSGYNNISPGDGNGYLYVLDALSGTIIKSISTNIGNAVTPSGLAGISAWNSDPTVNQASFVYGGDLLGNVWRFDINTGAAPLLFATLKGPSGIAQPVTTPPVLGLIDGKRVIYVGTGKYLEVSDLSNTQVQSLYAMQDNDVTTTLTNPGGSPRDSTQLVEQTITLMGSTRTATANPGTFTTHRGWYADWPDTGERVNLEGKLVLGTLIMPTIVPANTVCSPGGYGWLNYFNYETGGPVKDIVSQKFDSPIVGVNIIFIKGKPLLEVVTATNPTPELPPVGVDFGDLNAGFSSKRTIWRELIP
ncbi:MAG: hypothetical protein HY938_07115 [Nitrosomonadales bacterium]|nr:hypothetical protein [Nitrosomonadales bacterium]